MSIIININDGREGTTEISVEKEDAVEVLEQIIQELQGDEE